MKIKYFSRFILLSLVTSMFFACNSNDNEIDIASLSQNSVVTMFRVSAAPQNKADSITYPVLVKTKFTIVTRGGANEIYNVDSLPCGINIQTLHMELKYAGAPSRVNLLYNKEGKTDLDSIVEWNSTDSVQFLVNEKLPVIEVFAQNGRDKRRYTVDFNIHKLDPDSITWNEMANMPLIGENKTVINHDGDTFFSFVKKADKSISLFQSPLTPFAWGGEFVTDLPNTEDMVMESLSIGENIFAVMSKSGKAYYSADGVSWTQGINLVSIVGKLPKLVDTNPDNEFLIIQENLIGDKIFAKTNDFATVLPINKLTGSPQNIMPANFPVKKASALVFKGEKDVTERLLVSGGFAADNDLLKRTWMITHIAADEVSVVPGAENTIHPYRQGVQLFPYDKLLYSLANDSLYNSRSFGDKWFKAYKKQVVDKGMRGVSRASVIVDKEENIWFFGGEYSIGYSAIVRRGKLNRLMK